MAPRGFTAETTASQLVDELAPHIKGKVILITGPSPKSLGETFVKTIARASPGLLILAGRDTVRLEQTVDAVRLEGLHAPTRFLQLELDSLTHVRRAAAVVVDEWTDIPAIDVLVNNAGIMAVPYRLTENGHESQFAINHLGHFLFTNLIMPKILASQSPRVVNIASDGHRFSPIRWGDINFNRPGSDKSYYNKWRAYGQSKTANMLYTLSLAEKLGKGTTKNGKSLQAYSVHPGVIQTNLDREVNDWELEMQGLVEVDRTMGSQSAWEKFKLKSHDQGAATHVYAAFEPSLAEKNGAYLLDAHVADPFTDEYYPWARDSVSAEKLWKLSEKFVGETFDF